MYYPLSPLQPQLISQPCSSTACKQDYLEGESPSPVDPRTGLCPTCLCEAMASALFSGVVVNQDGDTVPELWSFAGLIDDISWRHEFGELLIRMARKAGV